MKKFVAFSAILSLFISCGKGDKGELVGVAFDGNIEAMAGDVIFDKNLQRTICVDIRYVLWIIDKYAGAKNIIDELTITK